MSQKEYEQQIIIGRSPNSDEKKHNYWHNYQSSGQETEVWMTFETSLHPIVIDASFESADLPIELKRWVSDWRKSAEDLLRDYQPDCYYKLMETEFIYQMRLYTILPSALNLSDAYFEHIQRPLEYDLIHNFGCPYVRNLGELD